MVKVTVGALLAAVAMMVWGCVWWMALPFAEGVLHPMPHDGAAFKALAADLPASGVYIAPHCGSGATPEQSEALMKAHTDGPLVHVFYSKSGVPVMAASVFGYGFLHMFASALLAAGLLKLAALNLTNYACRVGFVALVGVFAAVAVELSQPIWWHHPWDYHFVQAAFTATSWLFAGAVLAAFVRPSAVAAARTQTTTELRAA